MQMLKSEAEKHSCILAPASTPVIMFMHKMLLNHTASLDGMGSHWGLGEWVLLHCRR